MEQILNAPNGDKMTSIFLYILQLNGRLDILGMCVRDEV